MEPDAPRTVTPQDVLTELMDNGTFDGLRSSIFTALKSNDDLRNDILTMVEKSEVLRGEGAETKSRRQLMEELRNELNVAICERASMAAWDLILSSEELAREIIGKVDVTFCDLTGTETLGCECHPQAGPSFRRHGSQEGDNSTIENSKVTSEQTIVGSKRRRDEDLGIPVADIETPTAGSCVDQDSGTEKSTNGKPVGKEEQDPTSCNGSTIETPSHLKDHKGQNDEHLSSDSISDVHKRRPLAQSSKVKEEKGIENGYTYTDPRSGFERHSEFSLTNSLRRLVLKDVRFSMGSRQRYAIKGEAVVDKMEKVDGTGAFILSKPTTVSLKANLIIFVEAYSI